MKKASLRSSLIVLILAALVGGGFALRNLEEKNIKQAPSVETAAPENEEVANPSEDKPAESLLEKVEEKARELKPSLPQTTSPDTVKQNVPFTSQAPSAQWGDPVFQNGCEEASMIMADAWISGRPLPAKPQVEDEIRKLSDLAWKKFGAETYDTSAEDTAVIFREYFHEGDISVRHDVSLDDLRDTILSGKLAIVPVDGRKLGNPNFTAPGPEYHMLVVVGYDPSGKEFVTNDPGTRKGAGYRYPEATLFGAIRDYPTGHHEKVEKVDKAMIVIEK
jgi:hypothetical protein